VIAGLLEDEVRPFARRPDVLAQVYEIDFSPYFAGGLHSFHLRERGVAMEI